MSSSEDLDLTVEVSLEARLPARRCLGDTDFQLFPQDATVQLSWREFERLYAVAAPQSCAEERKDAASWKAVRAALLATHPDKGGVATDEFRRAMELLQQHRQAKVRKEAGAL